MSRLKVAECHGSIIGGNHIYGVYLKVYLKVQTSLVAQTVKHLAYNVRDWVQSLDPEDTLEKEMATHSGTLSWKIPWTEEPSRLQPMGSQRVGQD